MLITVICATATLAAATPVASPEPPQATRFPCHEPWQDAHDTTLHRAAAAYRVEMDEALARIETLDADENDPWVRYRDAARETRDPFERETLLRTARDQYARGQLSVSLAIMPAEAAGGARRHAVAVMCEIDTSNLGFLRSRLQGDGYPFGVAAIAREAFNLMILHADNDPDVQRAALDAMEAEIGRDPALRQDFLRIHGRWTNNVGGPGYFGERGECGPDGRFHLYAGTASDTIAERRARAGLPPLSTYVESLSRNCPQP